MSVPESQIVLADGSRSLPHPDQDLQEHMEPARRTFLFRYDFVKGVLFYLPLEGKCVYSSVERKP